MSAQQNAQNSNVSQASKSGYKGVYKNNYKSVPWTAEIKHNYKKVFIGNYATKEEAALAYNERATMLQGKYARLNELR